MTKGPSIRFEDVRFHYADAAMSFDAMVTGGAITAIIGPSGAGKSTLLNLVAGFERPDSGRVVVGDMDVTDLAPAERPVSMVFQDNNLFTHLEVEQNLLLGYELGQTPRANNSDRHQGGAGKGWNSPAIENACPEAFREANASVWLWLVRWSATARCCSWTSLSLLWGPAFAPR